MTIHIQVSSCLQKHKHEKLLTALVGGLAMEGHNIIKKNEVYSLIQSDNTIVEVVFDEKINILDPLAMIQSDDPLLCGTLRDLDQAYQDISFGREQVYQLKEQFYCFRDPFVRTKTMSGEDKIGIIIHTIDTLPIYIECKRDTDGFIRPQVNKISYYATESASLEILNQESNVLKHLHMLPRTPIHIKPPGSEKTTLQELDPQTLYLIQVNYGEVDLELLIDEFNKRNVFFQSTQFFKLATALMKAVKNLHDAGVVHGDLIPRNIILQDILLTEIKNSPPSQLTISKYTPKIINMSLAEISSDPVLRIKDIHQLSVLLQRLLRISKVNCERNELQIFLVSMTEINKPDVISHLIRRLRGFSYLPPNTILFTEPDPNYPYLTSSTTPVEFPDPEEGSPRTKPGKN